MQKRTKRKYVFGNLICSSKDQVRRSIGEIRTGYALGETVTAPDHLAILHDLLRCHVESAQKIGPGIARFFVEDAPDHPSTCFWVERTDGTKTDFGVPACLDSAAKLNCQALRQVVRTVTEEFKRSRINDLGKFKSDFSGEEFDGVAAHVHHPIPFDQIAAEFAVAESLALEELWTVSVDAKSGPAWRDPSLPDRFLIHHNKFPLQLVHWRENLSSIKIADAASKGDANL